MMLSTAFHLFVVFGVGFKFPDAGKFSNFSPPLEVVLVNAQSQTRPPMADALAQANLDGGGNTDAYRRAKSPLPGLEKETQALAVSRAAKRIEQLEQEAKRLMTRVKGKGTVETAKLSSQPMERIQDSPAVRDPQVPTEIDAADLRQRSLEIARLEAQIAKDWDSYQKRPKRRFIGARTAEYRFARYVEDWRLKVERVGNLNYPEAAKQQKIYGSLQVTVSIKSDGKVEAVEINRSSGHKVLDAAALRIVELAAPYAPFPEDIRRDTDILSITRTWTFTRSDQLVSE